MSNRTVKIRVAVAVDARGWWSGLGWNGWTIEDAIEQARDCPHIEGVARTFILTAELPIPEPEEVQAEVEVIDE